jgi:hypothetical protein
VSVIIERCSGSRRGRLSDPTPGEQLSSISAAALAVSSHAEHRAADPSAGADVATAAMATGGILRFPS